MTLIWGVQETETQLGVPGIFELPEMQRNLHSKHINLTKLAQGDSSFNLASTHGEGEGHSVFMPAVQTNTPEAAEIIKEVLRILHELYHLIMPLCVSCFEWDMMEFNGVENNVLAFGGLELGPTSCQLNSSSVANVVNLNLPQEVPRAELNLPQLNKDSQMPDIDHGNPPSPEISHNSLPLPEIEPWPAPAGPEIENIADNTDPMLIKFKDMVVTYLNKSIEEQGNPHRDFKDNIIAFTLFVLCLHLAPGSNLGVFLWMRGGIYLRESHEIIFFTSFKGHDIHMGTPPTFVQALQDVWISMDQAESLFQKFGPQVCVKPEGFSTSASHET
ncbi:hypothetical protein FB451DRAFT_1390643 [Mycena latifolia]|nr:hypothetical protein FB451DRAFT_1390643 [Mycena latifolia]